VKQLDPEAMRDCIAQMDAIRSMKPGDRSHAREIGHLLLVLDLISRHGQHQVSAPPAVRPVMPGIVSAAVDLIEQDPARRWTLGELSREVFAGSFHLVHEFKRSVGMSPMAYISRRRAERAASLLSGTDASIGDVGRAVGWPDPASFSRHFHKAFGLSPRDFRRRRDERERA
jgi:AraC family L-rhamnose operon transcriptional activator RhaR